MGWHIISHMLCPRVCSIPYPDIGTHQTTAAAATAAAAAAAAAAATFATRHGVILPYS